LFDLLVALAKRPSGDLDAVLGRSFAELAAADADLAGELRTSAMELARRGRSDSSLAKLAEQRRALAAAVPGAAASEARNRLGENVLALLTHVGDSSNLILDPDLDSYYLMDVENLALPALALRLQTIRREVDALADGATSNGFALRDELLLL